MAILKPLLGWLDRALELPEPPPPPKRSEEELREIDEATAKFVAEFGNTFDPKQ